jgi:hypothetical protein
MYMQLGKFLVFATVPFVLLGVPAQAQLTGSLSIAENTCVLPIATFVFRNCGYSGGANISPDVAGANVWIGPITNGGFYSSIAAAPGFTLSTRTGVDDNGVPLTSFLIGLGSSPGDGKVAPTVTGNISVVSSVVSGSFTIGNAARLGSTGGPAAGSLAGTKHAVENWTSITHTLTAKLADSVISGNAFGGSDFIVGSVGFPPVPCTGTGAGGIGDCYPSEAGARSFTPDSPWLLANGGTGPQTSIFSTAGVDIVSYDLGFAVGAPANVGTKTSATINGFSCIDTGLDPKIPGSPADTVSDCVDSPVMWSSNKLDPVDGATRNNASFDNLILKVSTDSVGAVVEVSGFYVVQYDIIQAGYNSWVGGTLTLSGEVPEPPITPSVYAVDGASDTPSTLYMLDASNGAIIQTVGPTGFNHMVGLAISPLTGAAYGHVNGAPGCGGALVSVDLATGAAALIGCTGMQSPDLSFNAAGTLYAWNEIDDDLYTVDVSTGIATRVGQYGRSTRSTGIAFDSSGTLYVKNDDDLDLINTATGAFVSTTAMSRATHNIAAFDQNDVLYTVTRGSPTVIQTIDVDTGVVTDLGTNSIHFLSALAFPAEECFVIDAVDDQFTLINDGTPADLNVLRNDECRSDRPISIVTLAGDLLPDQGGSATTDGSTVTYTPPGGVVGPEAFTYTAQDAGLDGGDDPPSVDQDTAAVTVNLLQDLIPDAVDDDVETQQSQTVFIDVLANDTLGNPANVVTIETPPVNGSTTVQSDSRIRYFPNFMFFGPDSFEYRLTDANGDTDVATVDVGVFFTSGMVSIDIMPGKEINNINLQAGGRIPVAILSVGQFFDAPAIVDPFSLKLGPREANIIGTPQVRDIDGDGDDDLLVKFLIEQTGIPCGAPATNLQGRTFTGGFIFGDDSINTFKCRRRPITY